MMNEEDSIKWDNDPFALKKTPESKAHVMTMAYNRLKALNEPVDSPFALAMSEGMPIPYAEWLKTHGQD